MKRLLIPLFALGVLLSACNPAPDDGTGPIKVGLITVLTGEVAALGNDIYNGARMMVDEVNAEGGINGRQIELIAEDGRCNGVDAASAAQKLVHVDKVAAIHGGGCSSESLAAAPIVNDAEVVMISPSSTSPDVTNAGDFVFRTVPSDALKTAAMAEYFKEQGYTKAAIISENTDFCTAFRDSVNVDFGEENFVFDETVEPGTKDFRALMTRLQDVDFDILVVNAQTPPVAAAMLQQLREFGIEQPAIGQDLMDTSVLIELAQDAADGALAINVPTIPSDTPLGKKYIAEYGEPGASMSWVTYGYDTMGVLLQAIEEAGTNGADLRDYLYDMEEYKGNVGPIAFDENGDVREAAYALKEVKNGVFVTISEITVD